LKRRGGKTGAWQAAQNGHRLNSHDGESLPGGRRTPLTLIPTPKLSIWTPWIVMSRTIIITLLLSHRRNPATNDGLMAFSRFEVSPFETVRLLAEQSEHFKAFAM
jgi:hypothetical protein